VRHARDEDLDLIEPLLAEIRKLSGLIEKKRGVFYRKTDPFLHFHQDPAGMFADLKEDGAFARRRVSTAKERAELIAAVKRALAQNDTVRRTRGRRHHSLRSG
jgi:hypothetical protein